MPIRMTAYGVSKAGVLQLSRQIAADHGKDGIRAHCVCPSGLVVPSLDRAAILGAEKLARRSEAMQRMAPLGRVCTPEDVARAMLFLLSDLSGFTTGAALPIEGGGTTTLRFWSIRDAMGRDRHGQACGGPDRPGARGFRPGLC